MNRQEFQLLQEESIGHIQYLAGLFNKQGLTEDARLLYKELQTLGRDIFRIMVVGSFNSGKSTFINALLGSPCLLAKPIPATAVITIVEYGKEQMATVFYKKGRPAEKMSVEKFKKRFQLQVEETREQREGVDFYSVREVIIRWPAEFCRNNVVLIDSPGLDESAIASTITDDYLTKADLIVVVLNATKPISEGEERYLRERLAELGKNKLFFVLNMWDLVNQMTLRKEDEEETEVYNRFWEKITPFCQQDQGKSFPFRLFPVSAKLALEGAVAGDSSKWQESGVGVVQAEVEKLIFANKGCQLAAAALKLTECISSNSGDILSFLTKTSRMSEDKKLSGKRASLDQTEDEPVKVALDWDNWQAKLRILVGQVQIILGGKKNENL